MYPFNGVKNWSLKDSVSRISTMIFLDSLVPPMETIVYGVKLFGGDCLQTYLSDYPQSETPIARNSEIQVIVFVMQFYYMAP